jgi:hypothetical protein
MRKKAVAPPAFRERKAKRRSRQRAIPDRPAGISFSRPRK